jgi:hypothetical protein
MIQMVFDKLGMQDHVAINKQQVGTPGQRDTHVPHPPGTETVVRLPDMAQTGDVAGKLRHHVGCALVRAVVDNNGLTWPANLPTNAFEHGFKRIRAVVGSNDQCVVDRTGIPMIPVRQWF